MITSLKSLQFLFVYELLQFVIDFFIESFHVVNSLFIFISYT